MVWRGSLKDGDCTEESVLSRPKKSERKMKGSARRDLGDDRDGLVSYSYIKTRAYIPRTKEQESHSIVVCPLGMNAHRTVPVSEDN